MVSGTVGVISFAWRVYGVLYCFFLVKNGGQEVNDWVIKHKGSV